MDQVITKKDLEFKIDLLIDNLVHLSDPTGEFSIKVADGSIIDNKSFNYWEWTSGIGLYGMTKFYELTREPKILNQMIKWFDNRFDEEPVEKILIQWFKCEHWHSYMKKLGIKNIYHI